MKRFLLAALALVPTLALAGTIPLLHVGLASAPTPGLVTAVFSSFGLVTGTANNFGFVIGGSNVSSFSTATTGLRYAMPFAGSVGNLSASLNNATTLSTSSIIDEINGSTAGKTVTCTFASAQCTPSGSPSDFFNQGDFFQWKMVIGSGDSWIQSFTSRIGYTITSGNGQHGVLFARGNSGTTGSQYLSAGNGATASATEINVSDISPTGFTVVGIWAVSSEGAVAHTETVCKNNSVSACTPGTGIFVTMPVSSSIGGCGTTAASGVIGGSTACTQTNLTGVHFALGDTISIQMNCPATFTCTNTGTNVTLDYIPDNAGETVQFAQAPGISTNASAWVGLSDAVFQTTQIGYQVVPNVSGHVTLSKLIACAAARPNGATGSATRPFALQTGANPTTLPTTPGTGLNVTMTGSTASPAPCPGSNGASLLAGAQDTSPSDNLSLLASQTVDTLSTGVGSPVTPGVTKVSYVAVVGP
jgi:hypothetical protein